MKVTVLGALLAAGAWPALGQFQLYAVNGSIVQPVASTYDFGSVAPGASVTAAFQITNISTQPVMLNLLTVTGNGFSVPPASAPALPVSLAPQQSTGFTLIFQAAGPGVYSGALNSVGMAITLLATVPVELTGEWVTGTGTQFLSAGPVNFGSVPVGQSPTVEVVLLNQTSAALPVPPLSVSGAGFSLASQPAAAATVQPSASAALELQFSPTTAAAYTGTLAIGGQNFALSGTGVIPPLPTPSIAIALAEPDSAQQGTIAVGLSAPAQTQAAGTVTLSFVPETSIPGGADTGIAFVTGGQSTAFNVYIGQKQGVFGSANSIPFETGTTAGVLTVTVQLGSNTAQQSITILPAVVGVTAAQGVRSANSVEVDLTGFDNTRTAGALSFTFFDALGNAIGAAVQANGASDFAAYFQNSDGGTFELKAVFPVVGDTSQIASFQATVSNSTGNSTSARTSF
ncbi:MAG TPA: choice-of-anchor D domain-containing protein [Bryobacteraceae bacterium]|nr:choice-of-anchor D domain-containing protein [Bryobacteraceae bacterium]